MFRKIILSLPIITLILIGNIGILSAHEYWIEPDKPSGNMQLKIFAYARVGQNFKGPEQYYIPGEIEKIVITDPMSSYKIEKNIGDNPIFNEVAKNPGLQILSYKTTPLKLTYDKFEKFEKFVRKQGLARVVDLHRKRGLPDAKFFEYYVRYSKALLTRGNSNGADQRIGFLFELIVQKNPYEFKAGINDGTLPIKLIWQDKPLANAQISVFRKSKEGEEPTHITTDASGIAILSVKIGETYMLNSVEMTAEKPETGAVWKSHWASTTFTAMAKQ